MGNITEERTSQSDVAQVKERVQDAAAQAKGQTREELRTQIDTKTTQVGEQVSSTARAMRQASADLRQQGNERAASLVGSVADRGERLGSYLSGADGDSVLHELEDFARRQPWVVTGVGAITGFLAARFVKASSRSRYHSATARHFTPERQPAVPTAGGSSGIG